MIGSSRGPSGRAVMGVSPWTSAPRQDRHRHRLLARHRPRHRAGRSPPKAAASCSAARTAAALDDAVAEAKRRAASAGGDARRHRLRRDHARRRRRARRRRARCVRRRRAPRQQRRRLRRARLPRRRRRRLRRRARSQPVARVPHLARRPARAARARRRRHRARHVDLGARSRRRARATTSPRRRRWRSPRRWRAIWRATASASTPSRRARSSFPAAAGSGGRRPIPTASPDFLSREFPFGRFGAPEEVADVVAFLLSPRARVDARRHRRRRRWAEPRLLGVC